MSRISWFLLRFIIALSVVSIVIRAWDLQPLYTNSGIRNRVQDVLTVVAQEKGWLLSGIEIESVSQDHVVVSYHDHQRGKDLVHCYSIHLHISSVEAVPVPPTERCSD